MQEYRSVPTVRPESHQLVLPPMLQSPVLLATPLEMPLPPLPLVRPQKLHSQLDWTPSSGSTQASLLRLPESPIGESPRSWQSVVVAFLWNSHPVNHRRSLRSEAQQQRRPSRGTKVGALTSLQTLRFSTSRVSRDRQKVFVVHNGMVCRNQASRWQRLRLFKTVAKNVHMLECESGADRDAR